MSNPMRVCTCIYCGRSDVKLKTEHIVPYGFGNTAGDVLLEASCGDCEKITSAFELYVQREIFGNIRKTLRLKSRRGELPKTTTQDIMTLDGKKATLEVPVNELFDVIYLPIFEVPSATVGDYSVGDCNLLEMQTINIGKALSGSTYRDNNVDYVHTETRFLHHAFEKFVMKIGYCASVKIYGYEAVKDSPVPRVLLGMDNRFGTWLGCMNINYIQEKTTPQSWLQYGSYDVPNGIVSAVKLFAALQDMPEYHVVIKSNI